MRQALQADDPRALAAGRGQKVEADETDSRQRFSPGPESPCTLSTSLPAQRPWSQKEDGGYIHLQGRDTMRGESFARPAIQGGASMTVTVKVLIGLAILAFVAAVFASRMWPIFGIPPEAFSRASNNLALIAIALSVCFKRESTGVRG